MCQLNMAAHCRSLHAILSILTRFYTIMCPRSLQKTGEVAMEVVVQPTAEGRFLAVACEVAATSRPWVTTTVPTQTPAPKPHPSPPWLLRGTPSDGLSAWIKGRVSQMSSFRLKDVSLVVPSPVSKVVWIFANITATWYPCCYWSIEIHARMLFFLFFIFIFHHAAASQCLTVLF